VFSQQSKVQGQSGGAPLTNFSWNEKIPSLVVTSSIDTTCTVWNLDTSTAVTQLIAHDREVYDVAWLPNSTDIFVSVGADGSLRAFDLRSLEHSTILYETPPPKNQPPTGRPPSSPLLRIAFNPGDPNYMSTFHQDGTDVQILDMRSPGAPVMELRAHRAPINAAGWSSTERGLVATAGGWSGFFLVLMGRSLILHSGRLSVACLGHLAPCPRTCGISTQRELSTELSKAVGREEARDLGPNNGILGTKRDHESGMVPADRADDDEHGTLDTRRGMDCGRHGQVDQGAQSIGVGREL
jgi:hypothetical protein